MNRIEISINTVNAAFDNIAKAEVARILRELATKLEHGHEPEMLRDINGNVVGEVLYLE